MRGEKGLVFAVAKPPPQHRRRSRRKLPTQTGIHAQVADFVLDESERPRAALDQGRGGGRDFIGQTEQLRAVELLGPRRHRASGDLAPGRDVGNLQPALQAQPAGDARLRFDHRRVIHAPRPNRLSPDFLDARREIIRGAFPPHRLRGGKAHLQSEAVQRQMRGHARVEPVALRQKPWRGADGIAHVHDVAHAHILEEHHGREPAIDHQTVQTFFALEQPDRLGPSVIPRGAATPHDQRVNRQLLHLGVKIPLPLRGVMHLLHRVEPVDQPLVILPPRGVVPAVDEQDRIATRAGLGRRCRRRARAHPLRGRSHGYAFAEGRGNKVFCAHSVVRRWTRNTFSPPLTSAFWRREAGTG